MSLHALRFSFLPLPFAVTFLVSCSSALPSSYDTHGDSGMGANPDGGSPVHDHDGSATSDGGSKGDSATEHDGGPSTESGPTDAGASLLTPSPPAGATKCGSGSITQSSSTMVCMMPNDILDSTPLPDGGTAVTPRACDGVTVGSGTWQVWCTAKVAYVWARFDNVNNTGTIHDCHGLSLLDIDEGIYSDGSGGGNGTEVATFELGGTEISGLTTTMPEDMVIATTLDNSSGTGGAADLFVLASLQDSCTMILFGTPTVIAGVAVTWK